MDQKFGLLPRQVGAIQHALQMIDVINQHPVLLIDHIRTRRELFSPNDHVKKRLGLPCGPYVNMVGRFDARLTMVCPQAIVCMIQSPPVQNPDFRFIGEHPSYIAHGFKPSFFNVGIEMIPACKQSPKSHILETQNPRWPGDWRRLARCATRQLQHTGGTAGGAYGATRNNLAGIDESMPRSMA
jgi:hypothetical protein